jgi:microcystin-dependent protein
MAQPYVGEIRMFAGNFAPAGWMFCGGQLLPISENETLFNLIGTTYGGDGQNTFGLPDMRGRIPIHQGGSFVLAETGGVESVTLTISQIPAHNHAFMASPDIANSAQPGYAVLGTSSSVSMYFNEPPAGNPMNPGSIGVTGGSQPHSNFQPYLCVNFIISLFGIFPSQT